MSGDQITFVDFTERCVEGAYIDRRISIRVGDIMKFIGRTLGEQVRVRDGIATVLSVRGYGPPEFNPLNARAVIWVHPVRFSKEKVTEISWNELFMYNWEQYSAPYREPAKTAPQPFDRVVDLRGLMHGQDENGTSGSGGGSPAVPNQERR